MNKTKKIKPVKLWAIIHDGKIHPQNLFASRKLAKFYSKDVIRVLITPIERKKK